MFSPELAQHHTQGVCFHGGRRGRRVSGVMMVLSRADEWALGLWQDSGKVNKIFF
jgi:hypothetical protein